MITVIHVNTKENYELKINNAEVAETPGDKF